MKKEYVTPKFMVFEFLFDKAIAMDDPSNLDVVQADADGL